VLCRAVGSINKNNFERGIAVGDVMFARAMHTRVHDHRIVKIFVTSCVTIKWGLLHVRMS
jgi:hypothetical protein